MTTYSIREFKAQASAILRSLDNGAEVIITRHGKPCGKLIPIPPPPEPYPSLAHLRSIFANLPDLDYADFQEAKKIWEPRPLPPEDADAE